MVRKTKQRDAIIEVLTNTTRPLSLQEILDRANDKAPNLGVATVYRTLKDFLRSEKISKIELSGSIQRYQIKSGHHHHHFWCRVCDKVFKVEGCPGKLNFEPPKGFKTEQHEVIFKGLCQECFV